MTEQLARNLRSARERFHFSQEAVAARLGVPRSAISDIETGKREVSAAEAVALAELYGEPLEELLGLKERRADQDLVLLRAAQVDDNARVQLNRWMHLCETYRELETSAGEVAVPNLRPISRILSSFEQAHELADEERRRLGLGLTPGHQLLEALEEQVGVKVVYLDLPADISGASVVTERFGPAILVNRAQGAGRRVFTLAHEYFHLLTRGRVAQSRGAQALHLCEGQNPIAKKDRGEQLADQFAGHLLLHPAHFMERLKLLQRANGTIDKLDFVGLAHYFGVSVQSVFVELAVLKLVPWEVAKDAYKDPALQERILSAGSEYGQEPQRFRRLAAKAYAAGHISGGRLAELLGVNVADVDGELRRFGAGGGDGGIRVALPR
jgi:Zn-dependent peptidase ImmA (M78 family)/plasmid maintenance system antidote protein VapI